MHASISVDIEMIVKNFDKFINIVDVIMTLSGFYLSQDY